MFTGLEELDGQVPLEWLIPFYVTRTQSMHQSLSNSWKEQINVFLLMKFVIWLLMVMVEEWEGEEDGVQVPVNMIQVMVVDVTILHTVEDMEEGVCGGCHNLQIGLAVIMTMDSKIDMVLNPLMFKIQMPLGAFLTRAFMRACMMDAAKNSKESPSRDKSPSRNSGGGENNDRARSRSRSRVRFDGASATATRFSYHESMLAKARSIISI
ncbi:uncharacterized protein [Primulina eburnea]|uniref:uncharacterized protein n=1 Tax=Primulina eburnea TaxID=1245227 RepID=UPI003C6C0B75